MTEGTEAGGRPNIAPRSFDIDAEYAGISV